MSVSTFISAIFLYVFVNFQWTIMKFMIEGGSSSPLPKARRWLVQYPDASRQLLQLLTSKTIDYLVAQVKAGAQVCIKSFVTL
jgi:uroporphyrinogen decarboxylase